VTLAAAIERWRAERDVVLAEQIDTLAQAIAPLPLPPPKRLHRWWLNQAQTYDPEVVTTLLAQLRAHASTEHLADRVRAMLAWPDDPRVGVVLAEALVGRPFVELARMLHRRALANPFVDEIAKRIVEIGDARAVERLASLWNLLSDDTRKRLAGVELREPKYERAAIPVVDTAWSAVVAEPFAIHPRLVLADAYLHVGDVRGEVIATQCAPLLAIEEARARGETFDASGLFGVRAEPTQKAIEANWYRWLGDVALLVDRRSKFRGGLLSDISIGHAATPSGSWLDKRVAGHRELCAVERVRPTTWVRPARYVRFLAELAHVPRWIHVDDHVVAQMRGIRIAARGVAIDAYTHGQPAARLRQIVDDLVEAVPALERISFEHVSEYRLPEVHEIAGRVAVPMQLTVSFRPTVEQRAMLDELRARPHVKVFSYGE
jgi:hypothetical protein